MYAIWIAASSLAFYVRDVSNTPESPVEWLNGRRYPGVPATTRSIIVRRIFRDQFQ